MKHRKAVVVGTAGAAVLLTTLALSGTASAEYYGYGKGHDHDHSNGWVSGRLNTLNNSGVTGEAFIKVSGKKVLVNYRASGLAPNLPHAAHIHYGEEALHECPNVADDADHNFRLNVAEGLPKYGPIAISLTTSGDTSPASGLAIDRFSTAPNGSIRYKRLVTTSKDVADAIRKGEGVLVVHGVDYNNNGVYDFDSAGPSELNPAVPAEATDPAVCGVLR